MSDWTEIINIDGADWAMRSIDGADWVMRSEATAKVRMLKAERDRLRDAVRKVIKSREGLREHDRVLFIDDELKELKQALDGGECENSPDGFSFVYGKMVECDQCGFRFSAEHENIDGGYSCPNCEQHLRAGEAVEEVLESFESAYPEELLDGQRVKGFKAGALQVCKVMRTALKGGEA